MIRDDDAAARTLSDAGVMLEHRYRDEISDRALQQARRRIERRSTPRVIQALPLDSLHEARTRPSCLPSVIVGGLVLAIAFLEGAVPVVAGALGAILP